jgi:glycosyltransferase involved in cell wall biosynthesis
MVMLFNANGDPCQVAINATALLAPLAGIGQYVKNLLVELERSEDICVNKFYAGEWSREIREYVTAQQSNHKAREFKAWLRNNVPLLTRSYRYLQQHRFTAGLQADRTDIYHEPNFMAYRFDGPTVITVHDLSWIRYPQMHPLERVVTMNRYFEPALKRATRIITDSAFVKQELIDVFGVRPEIIHSVLLGVGADFSPHTPDETRAVLQAHGLSHRQYMLALGTLEPRKNLQLALTAFERLPAGLQQRCPLVLVGMTGWNNDALARRLTPLLRRGVVRQLGYLPHQDLVKVVAGARCMVYPSLYEGFGLPPLESMACGVPVITTNVSSLPEVVADAGLLVSPLDDVGLAVAMQSLLDDNALHARLAQAALARSAGFTWSECARQTREVYGLAMSAASV